MLMIFENYIWAFLDLHGNVVFSLPSTTEVWCRDLEGDPKKKSMAYD